MAPNSDELALAKRQRCDGELPICNNCQTFNQECTYKDTTKKRGPPKGYIEAIENRLKKLEGYLNTVVEKDQTNDPKLRELREELESPLETSFGEQIRTRPQRRKQRNKQASSSNKTVEDSPLIQSPTLSHSDLTEVPTEEEGDGTAGQLTMDENGLVRYLGKSSGFYLLSNSRTYQNGAFHFSGYHHKKPKSGKKKYPVDPLELPPADLSEHLISLYLTHFYPVLPMFYKKRLLCPRKPMEPISPLLLNAIYAMASRISPDSRVRSDPLSSDTAGDIFFERARCLLDDHYDTPKISTVQALLLLASHQMGAMKAARAWLYNGMAFRMAQDLGLNRNCDSWNIPPEDRERRKRVFWCCFIVDRLTSAIYGRSSNFEEKDCDAPFPSVDDDDPIPPTKDTSRPSVSLLEAFIQNIKVCDILGHVLKNIYYARSKFHTSSQNAEQILTSLSRQLTQWHDNLPQSLQYKLPNTQIGEKVPDPPAVICQLHLVYYTTVILLHRSFIPGPTQSKPFVSQPCYKICYSAALSILNIVNIMFGESHLRRLYNFGVYFVFTAGIIFIKIASFGHQYDVLDAKININKIMRALDELEHTWLNAARCCNILGELAGLKDIKLESNEYVPKKEDKSSPPPAIAVPNSPEDKQEKDWNKRQEDLVEFSFNASNMPVSSVRDQQRSSSPERDSSFLSISTMDPFATSDIIPPQEPQAFDSLATAFWGMPTSLDTNEWNAYFGNLNSQNHSEGHQINSLFNNNETMSSPSSPFINTEQRPSLLNNPLPLDLPSSPSKSALLGFLDHPSTSLFSSPPINSFSPNQSDTNKNVLYW